MSELTDDRERVATALDHWAEQWAIPEGYEESLLRTAAKMIRGMVPPPQHDHLSETDTRIGPEPTTEAEVFAEGQRIARQRKAEIDALHTPVETSEQ